jgi:hypothetical protein
MTWYPSSDAAYGAAHARIVASLASTGVEHRTAHKLASEILNDLAGDGWKWTYREPVPEEKPTEASPPPAGWEDLRDALRAQNAEQLAEMARRDDKIRAPQSA